MIYLITLAAHRSKPILKHANVDFVLKFKIYLYEMNRSDKIQMTDNVYSVLPSSIDGWNRKNSILIDENEQSISIRFLFNILLYNSYILHACHCYLLFRTFFKWKLCRSLNRGFRIWFRMHACETQISNFQKDVNIWHGTWACEKRV
jgi:hypothetical protein